MTFTQESGSSAIPPVEARRGGRRPWELLDPALAAVIAPVLPAVGEQIIDEIVQVVPEYRRALVGPFARNVRAGVRMALTELLELIGRSGPETLAHREIYVGLGRGELRAGRSLDALQAAYRAGMRVAWHGVSSAAQQAGADAATVSLLAESLFAYVDEISAASVEGYALAQAVEAGEQQRQRQRLVRLLLEEEPPDAEVLGEAVAAAGWAAPRSLAVLCTREDDVGRLTGRLGVDVIGGRVGELTCALISDPEAPGRREQLAHALVEHTAALGPTVALGEARRSFRLGRLALALAEAGVLPTHGLVPVDEHLVTLLLAREPSLTDELAQRRLAPLLALRPKARERLQLTLAAWLRAQGSVAAVAAALQLHPQTVRYRLARLRDLFGDTLDDPDARFELELVLRALAAGGGAALPVGA